MAAARHVTSVRTSRRRQTGAAIGQSFGARRALAAEFTDEQVARIVPGDRGEGKGGQRRPGRRLTGVPEVSRFPPAPEDHTCYTAGMKTAISIPDDLFREAEMAAKKQGLNRSQLFARALREFLARQKDDGVTAQLDRVYGAGDAGDPELERAALSDLPEEEW